MSDFYTCRASQVFNLPIPYSLFIISVNLLSPIRLPHTHGPVTIHSTMGNLLVAIWLSLPKQQSPTGSSGSSRGQENQGLSQYLTETWSQCSQNLKSNPYFQWCLPTVLISTFNSRFKTYSVIHAEPPGDVSFPSVMTEPPRSAPPCCSCRRIISTQDISSVWLNIPV